MTKIIEHSLIVPKDYTSLRVDQALAKLFPQYSRSRIQGWLRTGLITIDKQPCCAKDKLKGEESVHILATFEEIIENQPEPIPLSILYEDDAFLVINKPSGLVVHPAAGNPSHTLLNALLHHHSKLAHLPRAGLIHRLDKDTSGLLVIAKTPASHANLVQKLQQRKITRKYEAIVIGNLISGGAVNAPIGRHAKKRTHMAIQENGKEAITHYRIIERFRAHTHLAIKLETGRTHQIRVHMTSIRHPLVGDQTYGGRLLLPKGASQELIETLRLFKRQALHAIELEFNHPTNNELMTFTSPLPTDMQSLLNILKEEAMR